MMWRVFGTLVVALLLPIIWGACMDPAQERAFSEPEVNSMNTKFDFSLVSLTGEPRLQVVLSFTMPRSRLVLRLPNQFLRKNRLFDRIEMLDTLGEGTLSDLPGQENKKVLEASEGTRVSIRYFVRGYGDSMADRDSFSAPIVDDDYFQFAGTMALVFPLAFFNNRQVPLRLSWHLPSGYQVYNSYGPLEKQQEITVNAQNLIDAVFLGGSNLRAYQKSVRGQPVYLVFEGQWAYVKDDEFINVVTKLLEKQRETWNDDNFPYFLVTFIALGEGCQFGREARFGGTAHVNSFRAYYPKDCPMKPEMMQLISHELMHIWIGKKIKVGEVSGGYDGKWFSEGFTDYYGRIMAFRAGLFDERTYFTTLNASLEKYFTSKRKTTTLRDLVRRIYRKGYSDVELENIPYQQGEIMAADLNMRIRKATKHEHSLDSVIKDLLQQAKEAGGSKIFDVNELAHVVDNYVVGAFKEDYDKIFNGQELHPPQLPGCSRPMVMNYTSFQGTLSKYFPHANIMTYRELDEKCSSWLD